MFYFIHAIVENIQEELTKANQALLCLRGFFDLRRLKIESMEVQHVSNLCIFM